MYDGCTALHYYPIHYQKCDLAKVRPKMSKPVDNAIVLVNEMHELMLSMHESMLTKDVQRCNKDSISVVHFTARLPDIKTQDWVEMAKWMQESRNQCVQVGEMEMLDIPWIGVLPPSPLLTICCIDCS